MKKVTDFDQKALAKLKTDILKSVEVAINNRINDLTKDMNLVGENYKKLAPTSNSLKDKQTKLSQVVNKGSDDKALAEMSTVLDDLKANELKAEPYVKYKQLTKAKKDWQKSMAYLNLPAGSKLLLDNSGSLQTYFKNEIIKTAKAQLDADAKKK